MTLRSLVLNAILSALVIVSCEPEGAKSYSNSTLHFTRFYQRSSFAALKAQEYKALEDVADIASSPATNQRAWYRSQIDTMLEQARQAWNDPDRLFPCGTFTRVVYTQHRTDRVGIAVRIEQLVQLLDIVNDPAHFHWGETTPEFEGRFLFFKGDSVCAELVVYNDGESVRPSIKGYRLMKFGGLVREQALELNHLINEFR